MNMSDPIADMLTRIRNANTARFDEVLIPSSKMKKSIAKILYDEGYIESYELVKSKVNEKFEDIKIKLKYFDNKKTKAITGIEKVSKPITNWIIKSNTIKILRKIGEGNSSDIFLGIYRGIEIAEKRLHLNKEKNITEFKREVSSFISLNHPYLLIFFGVIAEPKHLSIITEYCPGGNLHELLYKKKHIYLSWKIRKEFLLQVAIGMNYLHTNNPPILHRDLKSLNILLTNDIKKSNDITDIKIADLGLSVVNEKKNLSNERVGTCHWMAPEVINCQRYTTKSDVYSFGIIIWEVCTRERPYDSINNRETILYRVSVKRERPNIKMMPNDTPEKLKELMEQCLEHEPNKRPSFENIIKIIKEIDL